MRRSFKVKFKEGSEVQLKTEPGKRQVTGYIVRSRLVSYFLVQGDSETVRQEFEIEPFSEKKAGFK